MSFYRLKLCGLSDTDQSAVESMLRLSQSLLSAEWQIIESGIADLTLFSFDTDAGKVAWDKSETQLSAALSYTTKVEYPVDIIFQKPLRKSSFADNLNLAQQKIQTPEQYPAVQTHPQQQPTANSIRSWLQKWFKKKQPNRNLPELQLVKPSNSAQAKDTIKDKKLLLAWIDQLPTNSNQRVSTLLANLSRLNTLPLKPNQHLELLEVYFHSIQDSINRRDLSSVKRDLNISSEALKAIRNIHDLLGELINGYEKVVAHYYYRGETAKNNVEMWHAINMVAEAISLMIIHHFQHYRVIPPVLWQKLHHFYIYLEACDCLQQAVVIKDKQIHRSFFDIYVQIMLTYLADPYSLARFEVLRLYQIMSTFIEQTRIAPLSVKEITTDNSFLLTGLYYLDLSASAAPVPLEIIPCTQREQEMARIFNIQPLMFSLSQVQKQFENQHDNTLDQIQRLTLKIIPHLDTTHRRYHRISTGKNRSFTLIKGIKKVYQALSSDIPVSSHWTICNQSSGGLMAQHDSKTCPAISVGDFVGIFEPGLSVKLATIGWLHIDPEADTLIGLQQIEGIPTPALCLPDGEAHEYLALCLINDSPGKNSKIFTESGLYSANRQFQIKLETYEPFTIAAVQLHTNTLDYESFSYKVITGS